MRRKVFVVLAFLVTGVAAHAQRVNVDSDPSAPFATYKTYAWTVGTPSPNPLSDDRIRSTVDAQLARRGLTQVMDAPNVFVATHVLTEQRHDVVADGFGSWGRDGTTINVDVYTTGALIVDLYDGGTRKLVWRGAATGTVSDTASKSTPKIEKALARMFQKYPASAVHSR